MTQHPEPTDADREVKLDGILALLKLMNGVVRELHEDYIQITGEDAFGNEKTELIPDDSEEDMDDNVLWENSMLKVVFKGWAEPLVNGLSIFDKEHPAILEITYNGETFQSRELILYDEVELPNSFFKNYPIDSEEDDE